jgi:predicted DNA-binding protein (UPF0251 family)
MGLRVAAIGVNVTPSEFANALVGTRFQGKTRDALRLVFVEGKSQSDAARQTGLHRNAVYRATKKFKERI